MRLPPVTLDRFVRNNQSHFQYDCSELSQLLGDIVLAAKIVNREISKAGLVDIFGLTGGTNTSGEQQYKLDILANASFEHTLRNGGQVCALLSEEAESFIGLSENGNYVAAIDPIDGSSNIDFGISIGTIFSIYKRTTPVGTPIFVSDILQKGSRQLAAGYVLYGSSNILVYTSGHGVNGFTFEPGLGEYLLSHPDIKTPKRGSVYSINEGLSNLFPAPVKTYLEDCKGELYTARYTGSLVADFHRNLLKGGIYLYPGMSTSAQGKLRLMFECNALAFVAEQAGGLAVNDNSRILDIEPQTLHQRTSLYVGSSSMVDKLVSYLSKKPGV
jgi:fructose-1,6-bisphosphatase I